MTGQYWKEAERLNQLPINQKCKELLGKVWAEEPELDQYRPVPRYLYAHQLMDWVLEQRPQAVGYPEDHFLEELKDRMLEEKHERPPAKAMEFHPSD